MKNKEKISNYQYPISNQTLMTNSKISKLKFEINVLEIDWLFVIGYWIFFYT